jgi:NitT/TauT family transport system ATP-binding protein
MSRSSAARSATNAATATGDETPPHLVARGVGIQYPSPDAEGGVFTAVDGVDLEVRRGEFVVVVGPSGCGKTTFLHSVAGLIPTTSGELLLSGKPIRGPGPERALVFQQPSLLPWRTVRRNVSYGPDLQGTLGRAELRERVEDLLRLVGLEGFGNRFPSTLSGGMQQRVNLARALAVEPELLLLDEPFAALDAQTRERMQAELLQIWEQLGTTAIFVTHDIKEAVLLADRVLVFTDRPGRVKTWIDVDLPRPRKPEASREEAFHALEDRIWDELHQTTTP